MKKVKILFQKWSLPMVERNCYVLDETGNIITECEQGETAVFECEKPKKIKVQMEGFLNKPKIEVEPGKMYEVSYGSVSTFFRLPPRLHIDEKENTKNKLD